MSLIDTISGEVAKEPVVTPNGNIYEKSLLLKHLQSQGSDPVTNEPLSPDDLIAVKAHSNAAVRPRSVQQSSIPGLMQSLQSEWDALMLETFTLKKQLDTAREELSQALYQNDAACRVIARLLRERDEARKEVEELRAGGARRGGVADTSLPGLDNEAHTKLKNTAEKLTAERRNRTVSPNLATVEQIQSYKCLSNHPIHKTTSPGILSVDIHPSDQNLTVTGGVDHTAVVFNRKTGKKVATLASHSKKVNSVLFHPERDAVMTGSADNTVKLWVPGQKANTYDDSVTFSQHSGEVTSISLHPTHDYLVSSSKDHTWAFHDLVKGRTLVQVKEADEAALLSGMIHPDGLIYATGTEGSLVRVWDLKTGKNPASLQGHKGAVTAVCFSENGYYLATAGADNVLKLWDLRGPKNVKTLSLDAQIAAISYDYSGNYLAVATGNDIRLFTGKNLDHVCTLHDHTAAVTDVKWGLDAKFLASTSMDRSLRFWGV